MDINKLISSMDFLQDRGYGISGFLNEFPETPILLDDDTLLMYFKGYYLNALGGLLKREVAISSDVVRGCKKYKLSYKTNFRKAISQSEYITSHLSPFFRVLQEFINGHINIKDYPNYSGYAITLNEEEEERANKWLTKLKDKTYEYKNQI